MTPIDGYEICIKSTKFFFYFLFWFYLKFYLKFKKIKSKKNCKCPWKWWYSKIDLIYWVFDLKVTNFLRFSQLYFLKKSLRIDHLKYCPLLATFFLIFLTLFGPIPPKKRLNFYLYPKFEPFFQFFNFGEFWLAMPKITNPSGEKNPFHLITKIGEKCSLQKVGNFRILPYFLNFKNHFHPNMNFCSVTQEGNSGEISKIIGCFPICFHFLLFFEISYNLHF